MRGGLLGTRHVGQGEPRSRSRRGAARARLRRGVGTPCSPSGSAGPPEQIGGPAPRHAPPRRWPATRPRPRQRPGTGRRRAAPPRGLARGLPGKCPGEPATVAGATGIRLAWPEGRGVWRGGPRPRTLRERPVLGSVARRGLPAGPGRLPAVRRTAYWGRALAEPLSGGPRGPLVPAPCAASCMGRHPNGPVRRDSSRGGAVRGCVRTAPPGSAGGRGPSRRTARAGARRVSPRRSLSRGQPPPPFRAAGDRIERPRLSPGRRSREPGVSGTGVVWRLPVSVLQSEAGRGREGSGSAGPASRRAAFAVVPARGSGGGRVAAPLPSPAPGKANPRDGGPGGAGRQARCCWRIRLVKLLGPRRVSGCGSCSGSRNWHHLQKRLGRLGILFPRKK